MGRLRTFCHPDDEETTAILFDIETYLRLVVRWEAIGLQGAAWKSYIPEELQKQIREKLRQEREVGYLDARPAAPLSYLMLSQLKDIMIGPLWDHAFKRWGALELIQGDFKKLIAVRNKIAHFRPVTRRDVRNVTRFAEDLVEWTAHYRRIREGARLIDDKVRHVSELEKMRALLDWLEKQESSKRFLRCKASLVSVGRFFFLQMGVDSGSLPAKLFLQLLDKHGDRVAFIRLGDWAEQVACYVSQAVPDVEMLVIFDDCLRLADNPVPKMAPDQVRAEFELPQRDYVLPWGLELPLDFRI